MRPLIGIPTQSNLPGPSMAGRSPLAEREAAGPSRWRIPRARYHRFCIGQSYCRAVHAASGVPILIPALDDEGMLSDLYTRLDGLLLAGGGDIEPHHFGQVRLTRLGSVDPLRDRTELWLTRRAVNEGLPVLAICRGIQVLNVALGGTLYQDIPSQIPGAQRHNFHPDYPRNYLGHEVLVQRKTLLENVVNTDRLPVNSFHHQAVKDVAPALNVVASAPDGVIEALEGRDKRFVLGVQWHPEELIEDDPRMMRLFEAFVAEASRVQKPVF